MYTLVKTNANEQIVSCTVSENRDELIEVIKVDAIGTIADLTAIHYEANLELPCAYHNAIIHGNGYVYFSYDIVEVTPIEQYGK